MRVLQINNLTKHYGRITAVNQLNLDVEQGQIMGVLGPNGSGKTTTLGIVLGITKADTGDFQWFNGSFSIPSTQYFLLLQIKSAKLFSIFRKVVIPKKRKAKVTPNDHKSDGILRGVFAKQHHRKPSIIPTIGLIIKTFCSEMGNLLVKACVPNPTGEMYNPN